MLKEVMDIPLIKTFVHNNKCYLYDTYTNRLLEVTKEHFLELLELQKVGIVAYKNSNKNTKEYVDIIKLMEKGMLKAPFIKKIEHSETKYAKHFVDRAINDITLQVTKDCNFRCRYCMFASDNGIGRKHEKQNMTWEVAKKTIDFLYEHSKDADTITIAFYGGEPMLNYDLIVKVVEYTKKRFFTKKIKYVMTINGSILNDEMLDFLVHYDFNITFSFDGPPKIQNLHRKFLETGTGTFDIVYKNVGKIKQNYPQYFKRNVTFLPVAFEDESDDELKSFFTSIGIEEDKIHKVMADLKGIDYSINKLKALKQDELNNIGENSRADDEAKFVYANKGKIPRTWHHNGPCIPTTQRLFIDVDGNLFICEKCIEQNHLSLGNIYAGIDFKKVIDFMNIGKLTEKECVSCWAMRFCKICVMFCNDIEKQEISSIKKNLACSEIKSNTLSFFKRRLIEETTKDKT